MCIKIVIFCIKCLILKQNFVIGKNMLLIHMEAVRENNHEVFILRVELSVNDKVYSYKL